jgi:glucose uptake protein GlcU
MGEAIGFVCCLIAGLCFGSNFVPIKKYEVADGVLFQWIMCCGIWIVGLITIGFEEDRNVHTTAMLGGMLWCIGNVLCVQVIKMIGMSMGLMIWGVVGSVVGWASGKFGLFGIAKESIGHETMNYCGLVLTVLSLSLFSLVSTNMKKVARVNPDVNGSDYKLMQDAEAQEKSEDEGADWISALNPRVRQTTGFLAACVCGLLFGLSFTPTQYERNHGGTNRMFDYVFSHFCGIFATSTAILLVYCAYKRNQPVVNPALFLPAFCSGVIWAIAQVSWFIAIQNLQMVVANPIVTSLPSIVAGFWGIVVFKEIEGTRNLALFGTGLAVAIVGVILVALSK